MHHVLPILLLTTSLVHAGESVTVFAAASLTGAVTELVKAYEIKAGVRVVLNTASSSTLAKQIENGAPADILISADRRWMDYLVERKQIDVATRVERLGNTLVVIAPKSKVFTLRCEPGFAAETAFAGRLAVGDPTNVPVGLYAKEAFIKLGWWSWLDKRIAPAADVRAGLKLVETGEADCGVVYATDARGAKLVEVIATIPADLHAPIRYPFAATVNASTAGRACLAFLTGPEASPVYERFGFTILP